MMNGTSCGTGCAADTIITTPNSSQGGKFTYFIVPRTGQFACITKIVLPLTVDALGNVETNDTSYQTPNNPACSPSSYTATVTGDPTSASGYTITIQ